MLKWSKVGDKDGRAAVEEFISDEMKVQYEILPNQQRTDQAPNGFMAYRISLDYECEDGILGCFKDEVGICCGISMFSAMGLPPDGKCNGNIEYVKKIAEIDLSNLRNGQDNLFVTEFKKV